MKRVSIFIDGNNFNYGLKNIFGDSIKLSEFDFDKFCNFLAGNRKIVNIFYYDAPLDITKNLERYKEQQRFFDKIRRIQNFKLILCKLLKRNIKGTNKFYYIVKEDDIHMAVDMVKGVFKNLYDVAVVVSGDGDFVPAVKAVKEEKKFVENIYFKKSASTNLKFNCNKSLMLNKETLNRFFSTQ